MNLVLINMNIFTKDEEKILNNVEIEEVSTIKKILDLVDENENNFAVVPVENSIEGIVRETVDNLINSKKSLKILAQTVIEINHCLLSKGKREEIKKIKVKICLLLFIFHQIKMIVGKVSNLTIGNN